MPPDAARLARLIEPWFDEIDRLSRRRTDDDADVAAALARFEAALAEWAAATREPAPVWRARLAARIDRALDSPWPTTRLRRRKLEAARARLAAAPATLATLSASRPVRPPARAVARSSRRAPRIARRRGR